MDHEQQRSRLPIESMEHFIQRVGLHSQDALEPHANQIEDRLRVQKATEYQQVLLNEIFPKEHDHDNNGIRLNEKRQLCLLSLKDETILLKTNAEPITTKLQPLATKCDTVYAMVSSKPLFQPKEGNDNCGSDCVWDLSLDHFEHAAVKEFVMMIEEIMHPTHVSSECVVDCCQIAHYLQCQAILVAMINILVVSVDSENCLSLLQLADRLNSSSLFEASLSHMMFSMNQNINVLEGEELPAELRERILMIKSAIQSSVVGNPRVYFASLEEYLAIFAEMVQYYKERLEDAKKGIVTPYSQRLIDKQERKVKTLEAVMREQTVLFGRKGGSIRINRSD